MTATRRTFIHAALATGAVGASISVPAFAKSLSPAEAQKIAEDAYIYGYSVMTTEVTRVQSSNVPKRDSIKAPIGQFGGRA